MCLDMHTAEHTCWVAVHHAVASRGSWKAMVKESPSVPTSCPKNLHSRQISHLGLIASFKMFSSLLFECVCWSAYLREKRAKGIRALHKGWHFMVMLGGRRHHGPIPPQPWQARDPLGETGAHDAIVQRDGLHHHHSNWGCQQPCLRSSMHT